MIHRLLDELCWTEFDKRSQKLSIHHVCYLTQAYTNMNHEHLGLRYVLKAFILHQDYRYLENRIELIQLELKDKVFEFIKENLKDVKCLMLSDLELAKKDTAHLLMENDLEVIFLEWKSSCWTFADGSKSHTGWSFSNDR